MFSGRLAVVPSVLNSTYVQACEHWVGGWGRLAEVERIHADKSRDATVWTTSTAMLSTTLLGAGSPMEPSMDAERAAVAIQEDSALLIQYRYLRALPPVITAATMGAPSSSTATATGGEGAGSGGGIRMLSAGTGFNLARAIRGRANVDASASEATPASPGGAGGGLQRTDSDAAVTATVAYVPSPKATPIEPTLLLRVVSTIVLTYENQGQPLLAMEALELGGSLCIDIARERQRDAAKQRDAERLAAAAAAAAQAASPRGDRAEDLFGGGGSDRAENLFGGGNDRAENLFGGGTDRAENLFGGGNDRAENLFGGGGGNDRAENLFGGGGSSAPSFGGDYGSDDRAGRFGSPAIGRSSGDRAEMLFGGSAPQGPAHGGFAGESEGTGRGVRASLFGDAGDSCTPPLGFPSFGVGCGGVGGWEPFERRSRHADPLRRCRWAFPQIPSQRRVSWGLVRAELGGRHGHVAVRTRVRVGGSRPVLGPCSRT